MECGANSTIAALTPAVSVAKSSLMSTQSARTLPRIQLVAAVCFAWLVLFGWFAFGTGLGADLVFGVCTFFAAVALGLPALMGAISSHSRGPQGPERLVQRVEHKVQTQTGPLSPWQAGLQILIAPAALAIGFTAIAIVDILVRHAA
jgi:hypothetical protein